MCAFALYFFVPLLHVVYKLYIIITNNFYAYFVLSGLQYYEIYLQLSEVY